MVEMHGVRSLDAIFVGSGPGSYSGTRVGIAAAQGAALVAGCKAIAIPSILAVPEALSGDRCIAVGDARRGSFWISKISEGQMVTDPELTDEIGLDSAVSQALANGTKCFCLDAISDKEILTAKPSAAGLWEAWQSAPPKTRAHGPGRSPSLSTSSPLTSRRPRRQFSVHERFQGAAVGLPQASFRRKPGRIPEWKTGILPVPETSGAGTSG